MRLIDADLLMRDIEHYHLSDGNFQNWVEIQSTIEERKKGTWVRNKDGVYCSSCYLGWNFITGVPGDLEVRYNYCPHCGSYNGG